MGMISPHMDSVSHFEIPADDIERAREFYQSIFGWQISKLPDMDYYWINATDTDHETGIPKEPGAINGGMLRKMDPRAIPTIVITVESLDERLKQVVEAGGSVTVPKMEIGKHGFYALISDTEGNNIGLWQNKLK